MDGRLKKLVVRPRSSAGAHAIAVDDARRTLRLVADSSATAISDLEGTGDARCGPPFMRGQFCLCASPGGGSRCSGASTARTGTTGRAQVTANFARTAKHYVCQAQPRRQGGRVQAPPPGRRARTGTSTGATSDPALLGELLLEAMDFVGEARRGGWLIADVFREHAQLEGP